MVIARSVLYCPFPHFLYFQYRNISVSSLKGIKIINAVNDLLDVEWREGVLSKVAWWEVIVCAVSCESIVNFCLFCKKKTPLHLVQFRFISILSSTLRPFALEALWPCWHALDDVDVDSAARLHHNSKTWKMRLHYA